MNIRSEQAGIQWTPLKRFLLRFTFLYWVFYIFPYGLEYLNWLTADDISPWTGITQWFGETFLGWTFDPDRLAKGFDSKYDFARFMLCGTLSLIFSMVWSFIDARKGWQYNSKLNTLMRTILRYHVGFTLFLYGIAKVYLYQFGYMGLDRMDAAVGNQSPMGFLWLFMSYSPTYNIGTGLIEMIGGLLLLFRRSTLLGAIISFVAMANVVLIDISYDVTVKMFAIHLVLMVMVLLVDDAKRLLNVLVLNKATAPIKAPPLFDSPKLRLVGYGLKALLIGYILIATLNFSGGIRSRSLDNRKQAILHDKYLVEHFIINNDTLPPLRGDALRWDEMMIGTSYSPNRMTIKNMAGGTKSYVFEADTVTKSLIFYSRRDSTDRYVMHYEQPSEKEFVLKGIHKRDTLQIQMNIFSREDYRLGSGKINWVRDLE